MQQTLDLKWGQIFFEVAFMYRKIMSYYSKNQLCRSKFEALKSSSTKIPRKSKLYDTSFESFNIKVLIYTLQSFVKAT